MRHSYNLIDKPWISCILQDGTNKELSLEDTLRQAEKLRGLSGATPLETASLHRFLLAVIHSALRGPRTAAEWWEIWQAGTFDQPWLNQYLSRWKHRFDLFDEDHPFFQAKEENQKLKSIVNIIPEMVSGNNAILFDHHMDEIGVIVSPAEAARILTVIQTFGLAGLFDPQKKLTYTDAPWARGVVFLLLGDNLFQTLVLNLLRYDPAHDWPITSDQFDCPVWESDHPLREDRSALHGYLDYLTWQNRWIWLIPENGTPTTVSNIYLSPGLRLPENCIRDVNFLDPMKHYRKDDKRGCYLTQRFFEDRAVWRDSPAWFNVHNPAGTQPPKNFSWVSQLSQTDDTGYFEANRRLRFLALGMASDQSKIEFFNQVSLPLPVQYLENEDLVGKLSQGLQVTEAVNNQLRYAGNWLALLVCDPKSDGGRWQEINRLSRDQAVQIFNHWGAERSYWSALERPFMEFLTDLPENESLAMDTWKRVLLKAVWEALDQAIGLAGDSPKAMKAATRARAILGGGLNQVFNGSK